MTEQSSRARRRRRLLRIGAVAAVILACVLVTSEARSAAQASPATRAPAGVAVATPELRTAVARTTAAIALEKRALALLDAYDTHHKNGGTEADRKVVERSVVGWLRASANDLTVAEGNITKFGETHGDAADPIATDLEDAVKDDLAAVGETLNFAGHHNFERERAHVEAALAAKHRAIALTNAAIAAPAPTLYQVGIVGAWNHVQPGVFSHFCLTVDTGGAPAGSKVKVRLTGPGVQGATDADLTTDANGFAYMTWTITQLGQYVASATLILDDGRYTRTSNGSVDVTSAQGDPSSCK